MTENARKIFAIGFFGLPIFAAFFWWVILHPDFSARYKLELTIEDDGKLHKASTVYEVDYVWKPRIMPHELGLYARVTGEALFVDLGNGRNLIVTLTSNGSGRPFKRGPAQPGQNIENFETSSGARSSSELPVIAFQIRLASMATGSDIRAARSKGKVAIPPDFLPTLVTFSDVTNPRSVRLVQPDNLETVFGPDSKIVSATLELTDENPSKGIEAKLPLIKELDHSPYPELNGTPLYNYYFKAEKAPL